jgi:hypothetical protein
MYISHHFRMSLPNLSLILRPTASRPVCLGIKLSSGAYDQNFITVRQLLLCWCGALSLTRGQVCPLQLLLVLASAVIFWSELSGTRDHILQSQIRDFPFCRLLRLAGLRWRYSTPPPHGDLSAFRINYVSPFITSGRTEYRSPRPTVHVIVCSSVLAETCLANRCLAMGVSEILLWQHTSGVQAPCHNMEKHKRAKLRFHSFSLVEVAGLSGACPTVERIFQNGVLNLLVCLCLPKYTCVEEFCSLGYNAV